eukprot:COSAG01_NODE_63057_length_281_cov_1.324176_1_plen_47_part_01
MATDFSRAWRSQGGSVEFYHKCHMGLESTALEQELMDMLNALDSSNV